MFSFFNGVYPRILLSLLQSLLSATVQESSGGLPLASSLPAVPLCGRSKEALGVNPPNKTACKQEPALIVRSGKSGVRSM